MSEFSLGHSVQNRPLVAKRYTQGPAALLLLGGVHGDETEGFYLVERFVAEGLYKKLEGLASLWVLPRVNPDGCALGTRVNANGVDLNRNMPTKDWDPVAATPRYNPGPKAASEPETLALLRLIEKTSPRAIFSAHAWKPMINYNGPCRRLAEKMAEFSGYKVADDIGYPTPGSLGTWAGWERKLSTITLEIEDGLIEEKIWQTHARSLTEGLLFAAREEKLE